MSRFVYPAFRRSAAVYQLHGKIIPEPYDYLENPDSDETKAFVESQNKLFTSYMSSSKSLHDQIYQKMSHMQNYPRTSPPSLRGGMCYFWQNTGLQNQNVLLRCQSLSSTDNTEVFLDPNTLSTDGTTAVKTVGWSEDEKLMAYSLSEKGSDWEHICVRDAVSVCDLPDRIEWVKFSSISWWHNYGFFYTRLPALETQTDKGAETNESRDMYVCFHATGTPQEHDVTILQIPEHPLWNISVEVSDCHEYLIAYLFNGCEPYNLIWIAKLPDNVKSLFSTSSTSPLTENDQSQQQEEQQQEENHNECEQKAKNDERQTHKCSCNLTFNKLINEFIGSYEFIGNDGVIFYFKTTHNAPRAKVVSINIETGEETDMVSEQSSVLSSAYLIKDKLLLKYLEDCKDVLYVRPLHGECTSTGECVPLPIGSVGIGFTKRTCETVSFKLISFLLPGRSYTMNINDPAHTLKIFKDNTIVGLHSDNFVTEQRYCTAADGTRIPFFMVYKKGTLCATSPVLLYGYGGFNISLTPSFTVSRVVFMQNLNGVLVVANIRGGGEYGEAWHDAGRRANKENCFRDFISVAKYLHEHCIGSPSSTAIMGGSNGGLLIAATVNLEPSLFACGVAEVGVMDLYKFHKFTIGHAWTSDYGNPDNADDFDVLTRYSPLHNIKRDCNYPAMLIMTNDHDDRVVPLHSLKYIATLQHMNQNSANPLLARIGVSAGHGAGKPTNKQLEDWSDAYTFVAKTTGATWHDEKEEESEQEEEE